MTQPSLLQRIKGGNKERAWRNIRAYLWNNIKHKPTRPSVAYLVGLQAKCVPSAVQLTGDVIQWWHGSKIVGKYTDGTDYKKNAIAHIILYLRVSVKRQDFEPNIPQLQDLMKKCMLDGDDIQALRTRWKKPK